MLVALLCTFVGVFIGIITGLFPGIHVNLVSALLVIIAPTLTFIPSWGIALTIIAIAITHTFLDSVPSIYLGAPDPAMAAGVLPGHQLLFEGRGYEAVALTVVGSLMGLTGTVMLIPLVYPFLQLINDSLKDVLVWLLIVAILINVFAEGKKMVYAVVVVLLSGILGVLVLSWPRLSQPLFPLLSGLFGASTLLLSLEDNAQPPPQRAPSVLSLPKKHNVLIWICMVLAGSLTGLLPGLGSAHAAFLATYVVGNIDRRSFLMLLGGMNTVNFLFSLATFAAIDKARNGAVVAVQDLIGSVSLQVMIGFIGCALLAGGVASLLTLWCAKHAGSLISKINYRATCIGVLVLLTGMSVVLSGWWGLFIFVIATALGMLSPLFNIRRTHAMACLLLPVIIYLF